MKQSIEELLPRPSVMGVVNVTPDSFSDGGAFLHPQAAIAEARGMLDEGAAIVDVGGESTRPGSEGVSVEEELDRVEPVLAALFDVPVSIDTSKAEVARRALEAGAVLVNDVTALRSEPALAGVVADSGACLCLMHMLGEPRTMQENPRYDDVVSEVKAFLEERLEFATKAGIDEERICLDPGIGFGKTVEHNLELLARLDEIVALGRPVLVGASRKRFLGRLLGDARPYVSWRPVDGGHPAAGLSIALHATGSLPHRDSRDRPALQGRVGGNRDKVGWKLLGFPGLPSGEYRHLVTSSEPYYAEPVSVLDVQTGKVPVDAEGFPKHVVIKRDRSN